MKIDRVRSMHVSAKWDYHEPLGEAGLARPTFIYQDGHIALPTAPGLNMDLAEDGISIVEERSLA